MISRPLVFLDIDGVLATSRSYQRLHDLETAGARYGWPSPEVDRILLDATCIERLNTLTRESGAAIVVSSMWRHDSAIKERLTAAGVEADIIGVTPALGSRPRGEEIGAWRVANEHDGPFVILDDDDDMGNLRDRLVQTNMHGGLREDHVDDALAILRRAAEPVS